LSKKQIKWNLTRVVIDRVSPELNGGRFAIRRCPGDDVVVEADIFADGHDELSAVLQWRKVGWRNWRETAMESLGNDRWRGAFQVTELGRYVYRIKAWIDRFGTWRRDLKKRIEAEQDVSVDLLIGAEFIRTAVGRAGAKQLPELKNTLKILETEANLLDRIDIALDEKLANLMWDCCPHLGELTYDKGQTVQVEPLRARFSAWYEMFPRSAATIPDTHGTFQDVINRLPYIAEMGFDVLYLPPIHPIARTLRKGPNNTLESDPSDPGCPWAIGASEGGHKAIHPDLGTFGDFKVLIERAAKYGLDIAIDIAFQVSPDHPWVTEHPEWFRKRPDGSIQYAENPPKKYQDIYPLNFETPKWRELWQELKSVFEFWIEQGVKIFRVDNPHTKPFDFWEWCIKEIKSKHPEVILLAEAFTCPKVMHQLARVGFNQSYTYFPWKNNKWEIEAFTNEMIYPAFDFYRASHWTNTPDILNAYLQHGGRTAFTIRFILAATLGANYGIYGPPFELCLKLALKEGSEEYLDSEKYQICYWDLNQPHSLKPLISKVNRIRRENPALQSDLRLRFHKADDDQIICYSKTTENQDNIILVVANLDPRYKHTGLIHLRLAELGLDDGEVFQVHDLLDDNRYAWRGATNYVELDPLLRSAHIFSIVRK